MFKTNKTLEGLVARDLTALVLAAPTIISVTQPWSHGGRQPPAQTPPTEVGFTPKKTRSRG